MEPDTDLQLASPIAAYPHRRGRNCITRMALAEDLRDAGYSVVEASNADEAMAYLNTGSQIDLVFSDVTMPGSMDGLELARRLHVERPLLPVILASGGTERIATFITKPYRMEQVLSVISKTLRPE